MSDDLMKHCMCGCIYLEAECPNCNKVTDADRIEELEAKLAKAQGALHQIVGKKYYADDPWGIARATLAALKGQGDEG